MRVFCLFKATPRLSEDKVKQCVDPRLKGEYPPKGVAKVLLFLLLSSLLEIALLQRTNEILL